MKQEFTIKAAAQFLGITKAELRRAIESGALEARQTREGPRLSLTSLAAWASKLREHSDGQGADMQPSLDLEDATGASTQYGEATMSVASVPGPDGETLPDAKAPSNADPALPLGTTEGELADPWLAAALRVAHGKRREKRRGRMPTAEGMAVIRLESMGRGYTRWRITLSRKDVEKARLGEGVDVLAFTGPDGRKAIAVRSGGAYSLISASSKAVKVTVPSRSGVRLPRESVWRVDVHRQHRMLLLRRADPPPAEAEADTGDPEATALPQLSHAELALRPRVPRRTFAWHLPRNIGEAVERLAAARGVPPSAVAEQLLARALRSGWLGERQQDGVD